jgi:Protein of unknown function (DUF1003)
VSTDERSSAEPGLNDILSRNIETLLTERKRQERRASVQQKFADVITAFAGSMPFVYVNASVFAAWGVINLGWIGLRPFDPNFVLLAMLASVEAIFLSTFVLISQNRMSTALCAQFARRGGASAHPSSSSSKTAPHFRRTFAQVLDFVTGKPLARTTGLGAPPCTITFVFGGSPGSG